MAELRRPPVETRDVSPRALWLFGLGFVLFIAVSTLSLFAAFSPDQSWTFHRVLKPGPVLQINPVEDHETFLARKRAELTDRGWTDREAGLVEVPIGEAMRLVSEGYRAEVDLDPAGCTGAACPAATPTARTIP
ncbi:MAG TPA: hypothetical protein VFJ13_09480 [Paracoccaceae bacterium]|nr:hypothetical protein [Paracoccaceae bacterium]